MISFEQYFLIMSIDVRLNAAAQIDRAEHIESLQDMFDCFLLNVVVRDGVIFMPETLFLVNGFQLDQIQVNLQFKHEST